MPLPTVLFTYDRPRHTAAVLAALERAPPERLIIFQDGLKPGRDPGPHDEVARLIAAPPLAHVDVVRRPSNLGLATSIITGVSEVLREHERVVVLEDDCVPSPAFLPFVSFALDRFADAERVFAVGGYALPGFPRAYPYDLCFSPLSSSWGWATWRDRWRRFDPEATGWREALADPAERRRFAAPGALFPLMLRQQMAGQIDSWAIRWYYTLFKHHGVCVWPLRSYVRNIGMDGSGVHGVRTTQLDVDLCASFDAARVRIPDRLELDPPIARAFRRAFGVFTLAALMRVLAQPATWPRIARQILGLAPLRRG
jgi:hypothetical protein